MHKLGVILDPILTKHPRRTCLGAVIGVVISLATSLLSINFPARYLLSISLGVLIAHLPTAYSALRRKSELERRVFTALHAIDWANFSESERGRRHRKLINAVLLSVQGKPGL
jgi:hypothetical protein